MRIYEFVLKPIKPRGPLNPAQARIHALQQTVDRSRQQVERNRQALKTERERQRQQREVARRQRQNFTAIKASHKNRLT